jgi:DNA invertase Pin-like site-specific DNA recombinase
MNAKKLRRVALYLRVSTDNQTVENQRLALQAVAEQRGWEIVTVYQDEGISGAKGRDKRPGLDKLLKDASKAKFNVVMVWAIDRLGRSLSDLLGIIKDLEGCGVDLVIHEQSLDTTSPQGKLMFHVVGAFAEFERSMIQSRVMAGLDRARKQGKRLGRPTVETATEDAIRAGLEAGKGMIKVAKEVGVGVSTVTRVKAAMQSKAA